MHWNFVVSFVISFVVSFVVSFVAVAAFAAFAVFAAVTSSIDHARSFVAVQQAQRNFKVNGLEQCQWTGLYKDFNIFDPQIKKIIDTRNSHSFDSIVVLCDDRDGWKMPMLQPLVNRIPTVHAPI